MWANAFCQTLNIKPEPLNLGTLTSAAEAIGMLAFCAGEGDAELSALMKRLSGYFGEPKAVAVACCESQISLDPRP
jgi:hypothetical protein